MYKKFYEKKTLRLQDAYTKSKFNSPMYNFQYLKASIIFNYIYIYMYIYILYIYICIYIYIYIYIFVYLNKCQL